MLARPRRTCKPSIHPRTVGGPAMQAPTSKRRGLRKIISPFRNSIVGAGLASARVCRAPPLAFRPAPTPNTPALAASATPKIHPRTVGGPAMQAPTSKRRGLRKKISLFQNFIVGASIARPLKPCAAARPLGWSRAPPLQCTARECVEILSPFCNSTVFPIPTPNSPKIKNSPQKPKNQKKF